MKLGKKTRNIIRLLKDADFRFAYMAYLGLLKKMDDAKYLKRMYKIRMKKELDLEDPKTYNEKLQWLKLNDKNPEYSNLVDKYEVKKYVSENIGEKYVIKTLGIWEKYEDIIFEDLPEQFVLKCTHDSGGVVICKNKGQFDYKEARRKLNKHLKKNFYYDGREWPYKNIKPRIIAEQYMEDIKTNDIRDYKFFCFNGAVKLLFVASDRNAEGEETKFDFFDEKYLHLNIKNGHPNATEVPEKPINFEEMKRLAEMLSKNIPHVRVDFYEINGNVYFGEMTFFHWSGFVPFEPSEWDEIMGNWITLEKYKS